MSVYVCAQPGVCVGRKERESRVGSADSEHKREATRERAEEKRGKEREMEGGRVSERQRERESVMKREKAGENNPV